MYIRDSVYLYDLFKQRLPQVWARDQLAWVPVRGQEISCTRRINELNCKIMDREETLKQQENYDRAPCSAETAEQKELCLSRRSEADRVRHAAT